MQQFWIILWVINGVTKKCFYTICDIDKKKTNTKARVSPFLASAYARSRWLVFPVIRELDGAGILDESFRLKTFEHFPENCNVSFIRLSASGFYFTGQGTRIVCAFCGTRYDILPTNVHFDDVTCFTHKEHCRPTWGNECGNISWTNRPPSPLSIGTPNLPRPDHSNWTCGPDERAILQYKFPGIRTEIPMFPQFATFSKRMDTLRQWPVAGSGAEFARAGFFYCCLSRHLRCFYCGWMLYDSRIHEDPWTEHARCSPDCVWLIQHTEPGARAVADIHANGHRENGQQRNQMLCRVCNKEEIQFAYLPCGHLVGENCARGVKICQFCRTQVQAQSRVYTQ